MSPIPATAPSAAAISSAGIPSGKTEAQIASKLTIVDPLRNFSISDAIISGNTITITYQGSKTGTGEHISAVLRNSNASGTHYQGRIVTNVASNKSSDTINITLPTGIANGTYRLVVYNEKENGGTQTNVAGFDAKTLTVDSTNTITDADLKGPTASGYYNTTTNKIRVIAQDTGSGLWKITSDPQGQVVKYTYTGAPTTQETTQISELLTTVYVFDQEGNKTKVDLEEAIDPPTVTSIHYNSTNKGFKVVAEDPTGITQITDQNQNVLQAIAGAPTAIATNFTVATVPQEIWVHNSATYAPIASANFIADTTTPQASVSYSNGTYTITATEEQGGSGLWKIADPDGTPLPATSYNAYNTAADFTGTYPSSQTYQKAGPITISNAVVYDAVNNPTNVELDTQAPTVTGFYNNTKVKLIAHYDTAGLWKITKDAAGSTIVKSYSGETSPQTTIVSTYAPSVYAFDQAGNKSAEISLTQDTAAPTAVVTYNEGNISIDVTDAAGIAQVGSDTSSYITYPTSASNIPVAANTSSVQVVDALDNSTYIPIDTQAPSYAPVTYNEGKYTISVTDADSGLWKITDENDVVLEDINGDDAQYPSPYPKVATSFTGQGPRASIKLFDAAGNSTSVPLEVTPPVASGFYNESKIKITAEDSGAGLWKVTETNDITAPDIEGVGHSFEENISQQTRVISSNLSTVYVFDHAGNSTQVNLVQDETGPDVAVSYNQGTYTITATDLGTNQGAPAGLSRITDAQGTILPAHGTQVAADYSATYPTTQITYIGEGPIESITAYDALDNETALNLAYAAPTVLNNTAYYKGTTALVKATDQGGAKLWKVVAQGSETPIGSFAGSEATEVTTCTIPSEIDTDTYKVYVVDHAGNVSEPITLVQDTAAPTIATSIDAGIITLTVSDPVGVARIDSETYTDYAQSKSITISPEKTQVYVEDALGNSDTLEIDTTAPQVTKAFKKGTTAIIEARAQGIDLCKVSESSDFSDTGIAFTNTEQQILQVTLSDENVTTLYVYDIAGHKATVNLVSDTEGPTATPTYNHGTITIDVDDAGVGIAQVGSDTASYTSYPTSASNIEVATGTASVALVDALNNPSSVAIDNTAPTGVAGYYKGTTGVLTVEDEQGGSGLWKIAKTDGTELLGVASGNRYTFTKDSESNYVKVYDQAGNTQTEEPIQLILDETPPQVGVTYSGGSYIITASDNAGIWRITDAQGNILKNYGEVNREIPQE